MSGAGLSTDNDIVQIGTDTNYVVAQGGPMTSRTSYVRILTDFNPFRWPELQTDDSLRWHRIGSVPGVDYPSIRPLEFTIRVKRSTAAALRALLNQLSTICKPIDTVGTEQELAFNVLGTKMVVFGRYRGLDVIDTTYVGLYEATLRIRFLATDPVFYAIAETSSSIAIYNTLISDMHTLFALRIQQPFTDGAYTSVAGGGQVPITRWRLIINGPALNPVFTNSSVGILEGFWLAGTSQSRLSAGQTIEVRSDIRKVFHNGTTVEMNDAISYPGGWNTLSENGFNASIMVNNKVLASDSKAAGTTPNGTLYYRPGYWTVPV